MKSIHAAGAARQFDNAVHDGDHKLPPGEFFMNVRAFDAHRIGPATDRACLTTPHMRDGRFELDPRGYWRLPKREYAHGHKLTTAGSGVEVAA